MYCCTLHLTFLSIHMCTHRFSHALSSQIRGQDLEELVGARESHMQNPSQQGRQKEKEVRTRGSITAKTIKYLNFLIIKMGTGSTYNKNRPPDQVLEDAR